MAQIADRRPGARIGLAVGDPQWRVIAARIESLDWRAIVLAADDAIELAIAEFAQLFGNCSIRPEYGGRGRRGSRCGRRRRFGTCRGRRAGYSGTAGFGVGGLAFRGLVFGGGFRRLNWLVGVGGSGGL